MKWIYEGEEFTSEKLQQGAYGFIYEMTATIDGNQVKYIGKKNFYSQRKKKLKNLSSDKRKKTYEIVTKLDYENYYSSNEVLKAAYKNNIQITRRILKICFSKTELTYQETKYQFIYEVLEKREYLNGNILGKFFKQL